MPARIEWAVRTVAALRPASVLEVGCGRGVPLHRLAEELPSARLVGLDRSASAVRAARERNREGIDAGSVSVVEGSLADMRDGDIYGVFDVVFAVNVNVFWLDPGRELDVVRRLLAPEGRFLLFYEPPSESQARRIKRDLVSRLGESGFEVVKSVPEPLGVANAVAVCAVYRPA